MMEAHNNKEIADFILLLCASIMSDTSAIKLDNNHRCQASGFHSNFLQKNDQPKKPSQVIENYVPEGDMANKKDSKT
jgi:hypothetical protein